MSNNSNLSALAAALDDGTSGQVLQSTGSGGVQFADSSGSGVTVHANQAAMLTDAASSDEGTLHYETDNNRLYVKMSAGFFLLASITNVSPSIDSFSENTGGAGANNLTADGTFTLTAGSNTVITINASDANLDTLSYSATVTSGTATDVFSSPSFPVSNQSSNVFTLTPASATGGTVTIRFDVSDGTNVSNVSHSFEISFVIADSHHTTLLMSTDGSAGDNNDITDSSSNTYTITANGDAHAGTFSPYRHGGYSVYFDGSGDYLSAGTTSTNFGTDDFTIEAWIYKTTDAGNVITNVPSGSDVNLFSIYTSTTSSQIQIRDSSSQAFAYGPAVPKNEWTHIAVTRSSGSVRVFVNGVPGTAVTITKTVTARTTTIGAFLYTGYESYYTGYISDLRVVKGAALYTSDFSSSLPTERLTTTVSSGTVSLLTCHLPYISDGSSSPHTITVNGNTSTKPIGPYDYDDEYSASTDGGSIYFDGNDNCTVSNGLHLGTGDFTFSLWVYMNEDPTSAVKTFINGETSGTGVGWRFGQDTYAGYNGLTFGYGLYGSYTVGKYVNNYWLPQAEWTHLVAQRRNGTIEIYVNGISKTLTTYNENGTFSDGANLTSTQTSRTLFSNVNGHVSDLKLVTGSYVYDGNFTPPTAPLSSTGSTLHVKGTDAHVIDKSQNSNLKLIGTAASTSALTSGSTPPYIGAAWANTSAVSFDGNSDYVRVPYESIPSFGAGEFTIEGWIYMNNLSGNQIIVDKYASGNSQSFQLYYRSTGTSLTFYVGSSVLLQDPSSSTISAQTWHHIAVTRDASNNVRLYVDGLKKDQSTSSVNFDSSINLHLGVQGSTSTNYFNGYMQDVRLSKKAFYTADDESSNIPSAPLRG